jgi:hypothetical protein
MPFKVSAERVKLYGRFLDKMEEAVRMGYAPDARGRATVQEPTALRYAAEACGVPPGSRNSVLEAALRHTGRKMPRATKAIARKATERGGDPTAVSGEPLTDRVMGALRAKRGTHVSMSDIMAMADGTIRDIKRALKELTDAGANIHKHPTLEAWTLEKDLRPAFTSGRGGMVLTSSKTNCYIFGVSGDQHLGSRFERMDALNDLYDRFQAAGVETVFNTGNWIEGEARFNRHEVHTHGMDAQLAYLVKNFPQRDGITTYAVSGDDHEGWYAQREGIDIGVRAEQDMRAAGREDWVNLGYMEAHITLQNATRRASKAILAVVHPGGGSAYALSYSVQKIIESLDGGEKPAVAIYGHYHKLHGAMNIRNVWVMQSGCTQDQTTFMRKKRLEAHVGGLIVELEQDPETGAIIACKTECIRYFVKGYYEGRFAAPGRAVTRAARRVA